MANVNPASSNNVVLVTTTFYNPEKDQVRYQLAQDMATQAKQAGYTLVVVDGSQDPSVTQKLKELGAQVFPQLHRGMGPSRREAYFHAVEVAKDRKSPIFVWLEPEKGNLIPWIPKIVNPIVEGRADVVIPTRTPKSWASYPAFQQESETKGNQEVAKLYGRVDLDVFFGPVASTAAAAQLVIGSNPNAEGLGMDTYVPQLLASWALRRQIEKVISVDVDFIYPETQRKLEETAQSAEFIQKRVMQLQTVVTAHRKIFGYSLAESSFA